MGNDCQMSLTSSVVSGFNTVFKVKNGLYKEELARGSSVISSNSFNSFITLFAGNTAEDLKKYVENESMKNTFSDASPSELFMDINNRIYPNLKFNSAKNIVVSK